MTEIDTVRQLRPNEPLHSSEDLAVAYATLMAALNDPRPTPRRWVNRRSVLSAAASVIVAAVVVVAVTSAHSRPAPIATTTPAELLHVAADVTRALPDVIPKSSQFYYLAYPGYQAWLSMDGTHDGEVITDGKVGVLAGCRDGQQADVGKSGLPLPTSQPCVPDPAYLADAPTTDGAMSAYLAKFDQTNNEGPAKGAEELLTLHYLRPPARAALFDVLAQLHGVTLTYSDGQVAVTPHGGASIQTALIFRQSDHTYLGFTLGTDGKAYTSGKTSFGITDAVGQVPRNVRPS